MEKVTISSALKGRQDCNGKRRELGMKGQFSKVNGGQVRRVWKGEVEIGPECWLRRGQAVKGLG